MNRATLALLSLACALPVLLPAQTVPYMLSRTVYIENDMYISDKAYTNGLRYSTLMTGGPQWRNRVEEKSSTRLLLLGIQPCAPGKLPLDCYRLRTGRVIGQNIFTPVNIEATASNPNDRPYAGYLYYGWLFEARRGMSVHEIEYDVGIIGPLALGASIQRGWHDLWGLPDPAGWDHQLPNAPAVSGRVRSDYLVPIIGRPVEIFGVTPTGVDLKPFMQVIAGSPVTSATVGGSIRLGRNLGLPVRAIIPSAPGSADDPPTLHQQIADVVSLAPGDERRLRQQAISLAMRQTAIRTSHQPAPLYVFASAQVTAVGYNAFLQGPVLASRDPSVVAPTMERLISEWDVGLVVRILQTDISFRHVIRGPEFNGAPTHRFSAVTFTR